MRAVQRMTLVTALAVAWGCAPVGVMTPATQAPSAAQLKESMRKLWTDHVVWTRQYIVAAVANDPSAQAAAQRLLRNQDDIGNAIVPFYGRPAGDELARLLREHITIAVDLVTAARAGDNARQTDANARWHANAAEIATFLSNANPNWPRAVLLGMLNEHLALTTQEAVARLQGRWADDVTTFDRIFNQAMQMADALTEGLARQFPARVS